MKSATIIKQKQVHLKLVKDKTVSTKQNTMRKIYINTLEPYFTFKNSKGEEVYPVSSYL